LTDAQNPFVWYEFMSSDVAAAKEFYGKVVGWTFEDVPVSGMTYSLLRAGERQLGGTVHREPTDIPNVGRFMAVSDRQGAAFALLGSPIQRA